MSSTSATRLASSAALKPQHPPCSAAVSGVSSCQICMVTPTTS